MDTNKIGEFLKALRKTKGYTQEEVANQLVLSQKLFLDGKVEMECQTLTLSLLWLIYMM